jgi:16S rRNA (guanine966-N2)-methyltransferase
MSQPRIISGKAKGIRIQDVPGDITRPITDRVKEALFNILGTDIVDSRLLDLFGGTGSVGIEALSRGASMCTFIDIHSQAVKAIKTNLQLTRLDTSATVHLMDAFRFIETTKSTQFDYIYIAPPQYKQLWIKALEGVDKNMSLLSNDGWVIVQIHPVELTAVNLNHLTEFDRRIYGSTVLLFYRRPE